MNHNKHVAVIISVLMLFTMLYVPLHPMVMGDPPIDWEWTIEGDTVFINNTWAYLGASPHTLVDDGWVEFELESKILSGDIDVIWGFNSSEAQPSTLQIWRNYTHNMTGNRWVEQYLNTTFWVLAGVNLGIENYDNYSVDYGNKNNAWLYNLSCTCYDELEGWYNYSIIIAFTSKIPPGQEPNNYTFYYYDEAWETYYYDSTFFDWKSFGRDITVVNHEWQGFNKWYMVNAIINSGHRYRVRCWVDIPFGGLSGSSGKYIWAIKEHGKTMQEAISSGHLIYLDPWWNSDWDNYRTITLDSSKIDNDLINFPVLVVFDNSTFHIDSSKSIRFTAGSNSGGTDNVTEYAYEIEKWDDVGDCFVWVNVTRIYSGSDTVFNMYYNNSAASDNQNPTGVWDGNYMAVWHMNSLLDSTSNNIDLTNHGADLIVDGGNIGDCYHFIEANNDYMQHATFLDVMPASDELTLESWANFESDIGSSQYFISKTNIQGQDRFGLIKQTATDFLDFFAEGTNCGNKHAIDDDAMADDTWYHCVGTYEAAAALQVIRNGTDITVGDICQEIRDGTVDEFCIGCYSWNYPPYGGEMDGFLDEIRVSGIVRNDSWIKATFHSQNQTTGFLTFGSEQSSGVWSNSNPVASSPNPPDTQTWVQLSLANYHNHFNISVTDVDNSNQSVNVTWRTNESGTWLDMGYNESSEMNATFYCMNVSWVDVYDTTYWWSVNVSDNHSTKGWDNETFSFMTQVEPFDDTDWTYNRTLPVNYTTEGEQSNYPMELHINYTGSTCNPGYMELDSHCNNNFSDIRFTYWNGVELDYWIKSKNDGSNCTVWIEVSTINSSGQTNITIHYGNSSATSESNVDDAGITYNNFEQYPISKFTTTLGGGGGTTGVYEADNTIWVFDTSGNPDKIYNSTDNGTTWNYVGSPWGDVNGYTELGVIQTSGDVVVLTMVYDDTTITWRRWDTSAGDWAAIADDNIVVTGSRDVAIDFKDNDTWVVTTSGVGGTDYYDTYCCVTDDAGANWVQTNNADSDIDGAPFERNEDSDIAYLNNGSWLATWEQEDDAGNDEIHGVFGTLSGTTMTWGTEMTIVDDTLGDNEGGSTVQFDDDTLWVVHACDGGDYPTGDGCHNIHFVFRTEYDSGGVWKTPTVLTYDMGHGSRVEYSLIHDENYLFAVDDTLTSGSNRIYSTMWPMPPDEDTSTGTEIWSSMPASRVRVEDGNNRLWSRGSAVVSGEMVAHDSINVFNRTDGDYSFSCMVKAKNTNEEMRIILRYTDWNDYYYIISDSDGYLKLYEMDTTPSLLATSDSTVSGWSSSSWHNISGRVETDSTTAHFMVYADDTLMLEYNDTSISQSTGGAGVSSGYDTNEFPVYSDNWMLRKWVYPEPTWGTPESELGNTAPTQSGEVPINTSTGISTTPSLYVVCTDADSDTMTATWRSNSSGAWVDFATNSSISTGTNITQTNSNFNAYSTTYWWSVNISDGTDWCNETYHFTTETEEVLWLDVTNISWALGVIATNAHVYTNETGKTFICDMDNTTVNTDLSLQITTDGVTWHDGATPAGDVYCIYASIDTWSNELLIVEASDQTISVDITAYQNETFDLRFDAPTSTSTGVQQTITITATIVKH